MTMTSVQALHQAQPSVTLVERLVAMGLISQHQLRRAMQEKKRSDRPLGKIFVQLGMISEKVLDDTLAELLGDLTVDLQTLLPDAEAFAIVPRETAERYCVLPIEFDARTGLLTLAVTDSLDLAGVEELSQSIDTDIEIATVTAGDTDIRAAISRFYDVSLTIPEILREIDGDEPDNSGIAFDQTSSNHPLKRLTDAIVVEAVRQDATAIHFEPEHGFVRVRFRVDGVLRQFMAINPGYWPGMSAQLAAMAGAPERTGDFFSAASAPTAIGMRRKGLHVSRRATLMGDDFIVGIAAADREILPLDELGIDNEALTRLRLILARPHGMVVVTGPPGCGKTSTLYAMLDYRRDESVSIVTLEDHVCCPMSSIRQTANAESSVHCEEDRLATLLQQDFDVLVIDELRNRQDATVTLQVAGKGRQVYAAVAAKSALHALSILDDLGVHRSQMAGNITGIVAQRLLRKLCVHCKQAYTPPPFERELLGASDSEVLRLFREGGCEHCQYLGYTGRVGIFEILEIDRSLDERLAGGGTVSEMRRATDAATFADLADAAVRQVVAGVTSLAEASRVVDLSTRIS